MPGAPNGAGHDPDGVIGLQRDSDLGSSNDLHTIYTAPEAPRPHRVPPPITVKQDEVEDGSSLETKEAAGGHMVLPGSTQAQAVAHAGGAPDEETEDAPHTRVMFADPESGVVDMPSASPSIDQPPRFPFGRSRGAASLAMVARSLVGGQQYLNTHKHLDSAKVEPKKASFRFLKKKGARSIKTPRELMENKRKYLQSMQSNMVRTASHRLLVNTDAKYRWYILRPQAPLRLAWDMLTLFMLLYVAAATPFYIGFGVDAEGGWANMEQVVNGFFIIDLFLNFITGYYNNSGQEVNEPWPICREYLKSWFLIDLLSSIPLDMLLQTDSSDLRSAKVLKAGRVVKAIRVIRLTKLIRFLKLGVFMEKLEDNFAINRNVLQLVKLLTGTLIMCHFFACGWFYVGSFRELPYGWIGVQKIWDLDPSEQYLRSFYWATTTLATIGYGDITPYLPEERVFAIVVELGGGGYFGYIIATMAALVTKLDAATEAFNTKMDAVISYAKAKNLPWDLQIRLRRYYKHYLDKKTGFDEPALLGELSTFLRQEVALHIIDDAIFALPLFADLELSTSFKPLTCNVGDFITLEGDFGREMFFLVKGHVQVLGQDGEPVAFMGSGSYFGDSSCMFGEIKRRATIAALSHCELFSLSKDDLDHAASEFPESLAQMKDVARASFEAELATDPSQFAGEATTMQIAFGDGFVAARLADKRSLGAADLMATPTRHYSEPATPSGAAAQGFLVPTSPAPSPLPSTPVAVEKASVRAVSKVRFATTRETLRAAARETVLRDAAAAVVRATSPVAAEGASETPPQITVAAAKLASTAQVVYKARRLLADVEDVLDAAAATASDGGLMSIAAVDGTTQVPLDPSAILKNVEKICTEMANLRAMLSQ